MKLARTLKLRVFNKLVMGNQEVPAVREVDGHIVVNADWLDLRPANERMNPDTKQIALSCVENILIGESTLTAHYAKEVDGVITLYDFVVLDYKGSNDRDPEVIRIKDKTCQDGVYIPLSALEAIGYTPHAGVEFITLDGIKYIRYRLVLQSASENRQCRATFSTYKWNNVARAVSANAEYLDKATQIPVKAIARLGLSKSSGTIVDGFDFSYVLVDDLTTDISFSARCYYDADDTVKDEDISLRKTATDGNGWITPDKAKELADRLGLGYVPSSFQIRYGQVKGLLLVFDYPKYCGGRVPYDIIFTKSMWKSNFDPTQAKFLVGNVSKRQSRFCELNYQALVCLNQQITFDDILPHLEFIRDHMRKALESPEDALAFLGLLADIEDYENDTDGDIDDGGYRSRDFCSSVDRLSAAIKANPNLAMQTKWVRRGIKRRIDMTTKKMLAGKVPLPDSSVAVLGSDPLAFFNALRHDTDTGFNFTTGDYVVPRNKQVQPLQAGEFFYNNYQGDVLAMRNPLTSWMQVRKLRCVSDNDKARWYAPLNQLILFNDFDETNLAMASADFDGDIAIISKLFTDKFQQSNCIVYNNNNLESKEDKQILTEAAAIKTIRANLTQNMVGVIVNLNTRVQELLNDSTTLQRFVNLAGYAGNPAFIPDKAPQMPYFNHFKDVPTATAFLERLNLALTVLSELEIDKVKTGHVNRFSANHREFETPFTPSWLANIKGTADNYLQRPAVIDTLNNFGEPTHIVTKHCKSIVKTITDTLKQGQYGKFVRRTVEMKADTDSIMGRTYRFIQNEIINSDLMASTPCYSINESLASSPILNIDEADRIKGSVVRLYKQYCRSITAYCTLYKEGNITANEFDRAIEYIIDSVSTQMREISDDRVALGYVAYIVSTDKDGSGSFAFLTVLDGLTALLDSVKTNDYYRINLTDIIPPETTHVIVYRNKFRLPEAIDPTKSYFGSVALVNGCYETHKDLRGHISLIIPKSSDKSRLNQIPYAPDTEFAVKVSYKLSELGDNHRNGVHVASLLSGTIVTFREVTAQNNLQYALFADDVWVGTVFTDERNKNVLTKDIVASLIGNEFTFIGIPQIRKNGGIDNNSTITSTGAYRSAQVLTFLQLA